MAELRGRVLVVTGASSGIGEATAEEAARAGMKVVLAARRTDRLDQLAHRIRQSGGEAEPIPTDVADDDQVRRLIDRTVERFGRLDAIFCNAGFGYFQPMSDPAPEIEAAMWQVNYAGTLACIRAALPVMRQQGHGHILICSSILAAMGMPYYVTYSATKAAQRVLANGLRLELEPENIHVTGVYPVGTDTEFSQVVRHRRGGDWIEENTPRMFIQSSQHVARRIVRALRRPVPEVWPSRLGHLGAALWTMFPRFYHFCFRGPARGCRQVLDRIRREEDTKNQTDDGHPATDPTTNPAPTTDQPAPSSRD